MACTSRLLTAVLPRSKPWNDSVARPLPCYVTIWRESPLELLSQTGNFLLPLIVCRDDGPTTASKTLLDCRVLVACADGRLISHHSLRRDLHANVELQPWAHGCRHGRLILSILALRRPALASTTNRGTAGLHHPSRIEC